MGAKICANIVLQPPRVGFVCTYMHECYVDDCTSLQLYTDSTRFYVQLT